MKILFAAAEAAPLAKVGGMADVVGTLPKILRAQGYDVRVALPYYSLLVGKVVNPERVWSGQAMFQDFEVYETTLPDSTVPLYLIQHGAFEHATQIYFGDDEDWRFTFFANAVAEMAWNYWKPQLIHCHDWHTGMIPVWMHATPDIGTVFTIHNLAYQGPWRWRLEEITWCPWYMQAKNAMEGGIRYADRVNTVSPTYARQICTPGYGEGLDGLLSFVKPWGILNGIDTERFDPATDRYLDKNYSVKTLADRTFNKLALQEEIGLQRNPNAFLVAMVTRLVEQKGFDLLVQILDKFLSYSDAQFLVVGTGDRYYETQMWQLASQFPGRMSAQILFNAALAQRVYAGADAFLMPSRFEPCGISQMIALRYGCVPIVRRTGGLVDTVRHHNPKNGEGNGFCFDRYEPLDLYTALVRAWESYQYPDYWRKLQERGMTADFSWDTSAKKYIEMYRSIPGMEAFFA
ncbi:MAG: glycogen synthase GlgA [Pseudanabaenaceae cyanobacterium]